MDRYLYRPELGRFARMITVGCDEEILVDPVLDASLYGAFAFGAYPADDPRVLATMRAVVDGLTVRTPVGGVARYPNDSHHQVAKNLGHIPGNPWLICTLWLAQHAIACARGVAELQPARDILAWVVAHQLPSGVLAEQLDPPTGTPLSVSPLTWSHAALVRNGGGLPAQAARVARREPKPRVVTPSDGSDIAPTFAPAAANLMADANGSGQVAAEVPELGIGEDSGLVPKGSGIAIASLPRWPWRNPLTGVLLESPRGIQGRRDHEPIDIRMPR